MSLSRRSIALVGSLLAIVGLKLVDRLINEMFCLQVGEGEKLVRALFSVAREMQPSVIFIGESVECRYCI